MEEKNIKNIKKIIIIIFIVLILLLAFLIYKKMDTDRIERKLKKNSYQKITTKIYSKIDDSIGYTYNINNNSFSKTIENENEKIFMKYEKGKIKINYTYKESECSISQTGLYTKENYTCKINNRTNECKARCDTMLKHVKKFEKEAKKIMS